MFFRDMAYKAECYYENRKFRNIVRVIISDGTSAVFFFRIGKFFQGIHCGFIGRLFFEINKFLNGCVLGFGVRFNEGFVLMHPIGVVINSGVIGGKNIVIESGVVIGAARNGLPVKVPRFGDNIFIGAGAKLLGDIKIGNNVRIGANAVVLKDIPDGATVVGIPAKVISINSNRIK